MKEIDENDTIKINIDNTEKENNKNDNENKHLLSDENIYKQNEYYKDLKSTNNNNTNNNNNNKLTDHSHNHNHSFDLNLSRYKSKKIFGIAFYHIGKVYVFGFKNEEPMFCIDEKWYFHLLIYLIEIVLLFAGNYYVFNYLELWKRIIYNILIFTFFISYSLLILINPGIVLKCKKECDKCDINARFCEKCNICYLPEDKISHCKFCDICVKDVDHHCDVVRRCITTKNFNYFISMIVNFVLLYAFALVNIIYYFIDSYRKLRKKKLIIN